MGEKADATIAKFERTLLKCFEHSSGSAWEPRDPTVPFFEWAIAEGFLRRVDGRFGVELIKDSMVAWTAAGKAAMTTLAALQRAAEYVERFAEVANEPEGGDCRKLISEIQAMARPRPASN